MAYSFSQFSDFLKCPKLYYLRNVKRIAPIKTSEYYSYGTECHKGCAFAGSEVTDKASSIPFTVGVLARKHFGWKPNEKVEQRMDTKLVDGTPFTFIADGISDDHLIEMKTTSRANMITCMAHGISLQLRIGAILFEKKHGLLRMIKKSAIRIKVKETEEEFWGRYIQEYTDKPQEHFLEIELPNIRTPGALHELDTVYKHIKYCTKESCWPTAAPYACNGFVACDYLDYCSDPQVNSMLYKEKENHADSSGTK